MSIATTLPRKLARRRGASTFSQISFISSGAGPKSGSEAIDDEGMDDGVDLVTVSFPDTAVAQAVNPKINTGNHNRFMYNLLDAPILGKLSYEMIT
jgi:hypothetical protein